MGWRVGGRGGEGRLIMATRVCKKDQKDINSLFTRTLVRYLSSEKVGAYTTRISTSRASRNPILFSFAFLFFTTKLE